MLMPKQHIQAIYTYLFKEGVIVAKNNTVVTHAEIDVPNLHVIKLMQSMESRAFVRKRYAWRHYYWFLTNEGIEFLRDYLHLPPEIVPATLKAVPLPPMPGGRMGGRMGGDRPRTDRGDGYRRREDYGDRRPRDGPPREREGGYVPRSRPPPTESRD